MSRAIPGTKPRPVCACCGKVYGKRSTLTETLFIPDGQPDPRYTGNGHIVKQETRLDRWRRRPELPEPRPGSPEWYAKITPETHIHGREIYRETWDGETYWNTQCAPFCGYQCAVAFAKAAYKDGARYVLVKQEAGK